MNQSREKQSVETRCLTCGAVGPANDFGLCKSCGAIAEGDIVGGFRDTVVLPVRGLEGTLRVAPASLLSAPKVLHHGRQLKRERGAFRVATEDRGTLEIRVKPLFVDPYPQVSVNGVKLSYGDPLPWYATVLAVMPTVFMVGGGCMGIALGAMMSGASFKALRNGKSTFARLGVPAIFNAVTLVVGAVLLLLKVLAFAPPLVDDTYQTVTSASGLSRMDIPAVWTSMPDLGADTDLAYGSESLDEYSMVFAEPVNQLESGMTLTDYAELTHPQFEGAGLGALIPLRIAGRDALQREVSGRMDGVYITFLHTVVDMGTHFYQVLMWTSRANFERRRDAYRRITNSFTAPSIAAANATAEGR